MNVRSDQIRLHLFQPHQGLMIRLIRCLTLNGWVHLMQARYVESGICFMQVL